MAAAPTLACTGALVSPRHVLTAASCVSRPSYDLTWTLAEAAAAGSSAMGLASTWGDFEFVPNLYGECSRSGGTKVRSARVPREWSEWVDAFVAASSSSSNSSSSDVNNNATAASISLRGSLVDANWALLTLEEDAPGAPGFFALGPQPTAAEAAAWISKAKEEERKNRPPPPPPRARLPPPGVNLSRVAYGGPDAMAASTPTFSNCPLLDEVAGAASSTSSSAAATENRSGDKKKKKKKNDDDKKNPSSSSNSNSSSPALVVGCSMYMGTRGAPLWQTPPSRQARAAALAAVSKQGGGGGKKDGGGGASSLSAKDSITLPAPFAANPSARSILGIQAASLDYWHAYHALDAAGAANHLRAVAPALSLSEQAAQGLAAAVTPEVARRLREWMLEDGISERELSENAGPARERSGAVADPRPPLLGGAASAAAAAAAVPASPSPASKSSSATPAPPRKGSVPTIPNLDAADRGRRATRAPGASAVSIVASVAQPGGTTAAAAVATAAAAAAAAAAPSSSSAIEQQQQPSPPSFDWAFLDRCPLPPSSSSNSATTTTTIIEDAPADAEARATSGKAGIDDPPLFGRHVPLSSAQAATFPFSATGLLRGYRNATVAGAAAAAVAGASSSGNGNNASSVVPLGGAPPLTPPHDLNCGAALVGPRHVLTAHHCVFNSTGRRVRDPLSLVFYPVASAGCGGGNGNGSSTTNGTRPARVVSLRALPVQQGCLEDLPSDASVSAEKADSEACAGLLSSDYALLELDSDIGDELGFFALGPAPQGSSSSSSSSNSKKASGKGNNLPAVNSTLTALGFGAASPETGLKVPSLSACTVLPTDAVSQAQKAGRGRGKAAAAAAAAAGAASAPSPAKKKGGAAAEAPSPSSSSPDAVAALAAEAASGDGHILYTGCAVTPGDSGGPLWVVVTPEKGKKKKESGGGKNGTSVDVDDDELSNSSSSSPERRLVGVASTVQTVWAAVSRADPTGKSNWLDAWRDTFGTSDALQSSAVAIDEGVAKRLKGWMADDGVDGSRLRGAGRAPRRKAAAAISSSNASASATAPSPSPPPSKPVAAGVATASAAVGPLPAP